MAQPNTSEKSVSLDREENLTRGNLSSKRVTVYSYDSATDTLIPGLRAGNETQRYDVQGSTIYTGSAPVGTLDNATGWTITKYDLSDMTDASGKVATDVSWDNRTTGTYA